MGNFFTNIGLSLLSVSISRALLGAGLSVISFSTITQVLRGFINQANNSFLSGDNLTLSFLGLSGMDVALSLVLSGILVRSVMMGYSLMLAKLP